MLEAAIRLSPPCQLCQSLPLSEEGAFAPPAGAASGGLILAPLFPSALTDPNASAAQQAALQQHLNSLTYSPFGDSPLFRNPMSDPKKKEEVRQGGKDS